MPLAFISHNLKILNYSNQIYPQNQTLFYPTFKKYLIFKMPIILIWVAYIPFTRITFWTFLFLLSISCYEHWHKQFILRIIIQCLSVLNVRTHSITCTIHLKEMSLYPLKNDNIRVYIYVQIDKVQSHLYWILINSFFLA